MNQDRLTLTRPDDWHLHLRDGDVLASVLPDTARRFERAMVMPNLDPPVRTVEDARAYCDRILAALPAGDALRAADDALPHRPHLARGDRARQSERPGACGG